MIGLGGASERLEFLLSLNADKALSEARRTGDTFERELGRADKATDNSGRKLQAFGAGAFVFAGIAGRGLMSFADEAEKSEAVAIRLDNSVSNNAATAGESVAPYEDLAKAIEHKTAADDEDVAAGEAVMVQMGLTKQQVLELTPLVVDYSRKAGVDMATAAKQVANAVNGKATALQKSLGPIDAAAYASDHYGAVMDKLRGTVGGFAEKEGNTFSGRMERLSNLAHDLEEKIGVGVVHAFEHFGDVAETVIGFVDELNPGIAAGIGEWGTYGVAAIGAAGALSFTIGTVERGIDRFATLADWLHLSKAAKLEDAAASDASAASNAAAAAANEEYALVNYDWAGSEADVIAAQEARAAASMEMALADGEAAAAAAGLIAAEEGVAAAAGEAAAAEEAANVAGLGLAGGLGLGVAAAAIGVGVFSALHDAVSDNTKGTDDYTKALEDNTGSLEDNIRKATAKNLADSDVSQQADKAGISLELQARAIRSGTDNWGEYTRQIGDVRSSGEPLKVQLQDLEDRLRGAGAGSTEFGQALLAQLDSGNLTIDQAMQLVDLMEGLHNGYKQAAGSAQDKADADSKLQLTEQALGAQTDDTTGSIDEQKRKLDELKKAEDDARAAQDSLIGSQVSLVKAHDSTLQSITKVNEAQDKLNHSTGAEGMKAQADLNSAVTDAVSSIDSEAQAAARAAETQAKANGKTFDATDAQNAYIGKLLELKGTVDPASPLGQALAWYIARLQQSQGTFTANIQADISGAQESINELIREANSIGGVAQIQVRPGQHIQQATGDLPDLPEGVPITTGEQGVETIIREGNRIRVLSTGERRPAAAGGVRIGQLVIAGASASDVLDELEWRVRMGKF